MLCRHVETNLEDAKFGFFPFPNNTMKFGFLTPYGLNKEFLFPLRGTLPTWFSHTEILIILLQILNISLIILPMQCILTEFPFRHMHSLIKLFVLG